MTYVVTEACIKCKYTDCVEVCPVDCFYEGPNSLVIDPDECIDCTLCVAECPVNAIYAEDDLPEDQREFTALNAELCGIWKCIVEKKDPPADADEWKDVKDKRHLLEKEYAPGEEERNYPGGSKDGKDEDGLTGMDKLLMR